MKKHTQEEFEKILQDKNKDIKVLGKYINSNEHIQVKCEVCDYIWNPIASDILRLHSCPRCSGKIKKSHKWFTDKMSNINSNIEVISKYNGSKNLVKCRCKIHNIEFYKLGSALLRGYGCRKCYTDSLIGRLMKTTEQYIKELSAVNKNIKVISEYYGSSKKIECLCLICGTKWSAEANALLKGEGCPICKTSHGERKIYNFLKNHNIKFESQKTFEGLVGVNNGKLSFDFFLPVYNLLIEYQGEFHDGTVNKTMQSDYALNKQKEHDRRKRLYAKNHSIQLLEIWYKDFNNIETILKDKLNLIEEGG